ncbi:hypothetical protein [Curtobacterium sp. ME26]|uniref:hypothetical protein n=1 Tax=Curtobacterium sp. ME26 TaxID=2744254 RepID=UPI0015F559B1|nr:hypothetical protein [Curtobacterium sp. ME26]
MKKTLRAVGATGLAAATIVTGLSFGPAASYAAADAGTITRKLVFKADGKFWAVGSSNIPTDDRVAATPFDTVAAARAAAASYDVPTSGSAKVRLSGTKDCLRDTGTYKVRLESCDTAQVWEVEGGTKLRRVDNHAYMGVNATAKGLRASLSASQGDAMDLGPAEFMPLFATPTATTMEQGQSEVEVPFLFQTTANFQVRNTTFTFRAPTGTHFADQDEVPVLYDSKLSAKGCALSLGGTVLTCTSDDVTGSYIRKGQWWEFRPKLVVDDSFSGTATATMQWKGDFAPPSSSDFWTGSSTNSTAITRGALPEALTDVHVVDSDDNGAVLEATLPDTGGKTTAAFAYTQDRTGFSRDASQRDLWSVGSSADTTGSQKVQFRVDFDEMGLKPGKKGAVYVYAGVRVGNEWVNGKSWGLFLTRPSIFSATTSYDERDDSFTLSGTTTKDASLIEVSADNGESWRAVTASVNKEYEIQLERDLTAGTSLLVRPAGSPAFTAVPLHSSPLTKVAVGKSGSRRTLTAFADAPDATIHVSRGDTSKQDYQIIKADDSGWIRRAVLELPSDVTSATIWSDDRGQRQEVTLPLALDANATDINVEEGTALLTGSTPTNADRVEVAWGDQQRNISLQDDTFSLPLDKLALGENTVTVRAYDGEEPLGSIDVPVDLRVQEVTASAKFDPDPRTVVQLSGKATPHTKVEIRRGGKAVNKVPVDADGTWTAGVNAPNKAGVDTLDIVQVIRGADNGKQTLPVDYGTGTEITSPADGAALEPGSTLDLEGKSQPGALVKVFEKGKPDSILGSAEASKQDGTWDMAIADLEDREYQLVASTVSKGYNTTTTEITINPGKSAVAKPTAEASFLSDITKKAVVSGTGVNGGEITVKNKATGETIAGPVKVVDGKWSTEIDPIGPGSHELVIEQTGVDDGTQTAETTIDYGASVAITGPSGTVSPGTVTVSGTGQDGAEVTVQAGDEQVETTVSGTTWSADIEIPGGTSSVKITATQQSKGALRTSSSTDVVPNGSQEATAVAITEPTDGYYTPGEITRIAGTATPYAQVTVRSDWDTLAPVTADRNGKWEAWGWYGPSSSYNLVASQERVDGSTSESAVFKLAPKGSSEHKEVAITTPSGFYSPGETTLVRGTATPFARVDISASFGYLDTVYADQNGDWAWWAHIGPSAIYELTATQTRGDGSTSKSNTIVLKPEADQSSPVVIDTPSGTYNPDGQTKVSGTSSPNAVITLNASWGPLEPTVTADDNGSWTFWGDLGPSAEYILTARQERTDGTSSTSNTITLKPVVPADAPVVIDTPSGTYVPGAWTTISGTSAPGAEITISADWGPFGTTQADSRGKWSYSDNIGPSAVYNLTATQKRADGTFSDSNTITLSPAN